MGLAPVSHWLAFGGQRDIARFLKTAAVGDGATDATAQLNTDNGTAGSSSYGALSIPRGGPGYVVKQGSPGVQAGGVQLQKNVNIRGEQTPVLLQDNAHAIYAASIPLHTTHITADVAIGDTNLTVSSSSGFTVGEDVFCRLGQSTYDAAEVYNWMFAKVKTIPDGTHITLDRPVTQAITVSGMATGNLNIFGYGTTNLLDGNVIEGLRFTGTNADSPLSAIRLFTRATSRSATFVPRRSASSHQALSSTSSTRR
jgi:hypothetical protein